jgi:hypothetical protein
MIDKYFSFIYLFIYRFGLGASAFVSFFLDGDGSARIAACAALYKASNLKKNK